MGMARMILTCWRNCVDPEPKHAVCWIKDDRQFTAKGRFL